MTSALVMQSFCHTAAYPKPVDVKTHRELPKFISNRGGVALRPGDGVIHSWLNRLLLPDTVGTGGDSHTRFPIGISFPAGSGLVAFGAATGVMPLDIPESVLVRFKGEMQPGVTLRDLVHAIPLYAIKAGLLIVAKPDLLEADKDAEYAAVIEIDLADIKEPILCCPNDPDDAKTLSDVAGTKIDEAFIGSCMANIGHFRAAAKLLGGGRDIPVKLWVAPPTKMDESELIKEGHYASFGALCGAQMRVIAFITESADNQHFLEYIIAETAPPNILPARRPPLWDGCDVPMGDGVEVEPDWD
jgi:aconitase B